MRDVTTGGAGMGALVAVPQTASAKRPAWLPENEPDLEPGSSSTSRQLASAASARAVRAWEHMIARVWRLAQLRHLWAHVGSYLKLVKERGRALP